MLQRTHLRRSDFILPVFVCDGVGVKNEVTSMPGVYQMSVDVAVVWLAEMAHAGFRAFIAFGVIDRLKKDANGSEALRSDNLVCELIRSVKAQKIEMAAMTDLCLCEYTSHGHCGPMTDDNATVDNDATLELLALQAINHANAGADVIAPSGMMDGMVASIRTALDAADFSHVSVLSYAVKYASAFYGPFRDAADSAPAFGDRHSYQMNPGGAIEEALREVDLDLSQGADMVMVKPAGAYLDVISAVRQRSNVPVVAYQVSGEYAMIMAGGRNGWIDADRVIVESLTAIKRAGADLVITYFGERLKELIEQ